jgi:hypothetical protein
MVDREQNNLLEGHEPHHHPSCFTFVKKKEFSTIILALQVAQLVRPSKSKVEIVLDVSRLNLAPHMAIMFLLHQNASFMTGKFCDYV